MNYILAVGLPFIILMLAGPGMIRFLSFLNFGQQVRKEGPDTHLSKEGIPTMGGVLILLAILLPSLILLELNNGIIWALIVTTGMGLIGFFDDLIKIRRKSSLGLRAREKFAGQILIGLLLGIYIVYYTELGTAVLLPLSGGELDLGGWFIPFVIITVVGLANGINFTDGLDGLLSGVTLIVTSGLAVILSALGYVQLAEYALIVAGACLGFIWFNAHPAQVFMGDVGSLGLGGAVAALVVLSRTELFILIIGGVYLAETLSVLVQVVYFKLTGGKRVFRMAPLHHHYELSGLAEAKIVARFWIITLVLALLGLASFYLPYTG